MSTEKHVRYRKDVETLTEAWSFVMEHLDEYTKPTIGIEAFAQTEYSLTEKQTPTLITGYTVNIHGYVDA